MIDRAARDALALDLRRLACGRITNDEFEGTFAPSEDRAIASIHEGAWLLYGDMTEHHLTGRDALTPDAKRWVARCILFLRSDVEYAWPEPLISATYLFRRLGNLLTLGLCRRWIYPAPVVPEGHSEAWPFFTRIQLRREIARATGSMRANRTA